MDTCSELAGTGRRKDRIIRSASPTKPRHDDRELFLAPSSQHRQRGVVHFPQLREKGVGPESVGNPRVHAIRLTADRIDAEVGRLLDDGRRQARLACARVTSEKDRRSRSGLRGDEGLAEDLEFVGATHQGSCWQNVRHIAF